MRSCPACYQNTCPEPPGDVTVNVTEVTVVAPGGEEVEIGSQIDHFVFTGGETSVTLSETPASVSPIIVSLNSGVQRPGVDYTYALGVVSLLFTPVAGDQLVVSYSYFV